MSVVPGTILPPICAITYWLPGVHVGVALGVPVGVAVGVAEGITVGVGVDVAVAVGVGVNVAVAVAVGVTVAVGVAVGVGLGQGVVSSSTVLTVVLAVLKPSATSTRPSGRVPCACPARLPIIAGPALNVPPLMVKTWVAVVEEPRASAPSVINSWPVPKGEMPP